MAVAAAVPAASAALPAAPVPATAAAGELWSYRIERGDTLIGLHARLLQPQARWQEVQRLNGIANPRRLQPGSTLQIPYAMLRRQPAAAEVLHVHGEVFVEGPDGRRPLAAAAEVAAGEQIVTGPQSSASLRFADGTRTALGPDSRLRVQEHARLGGGAPVQMQLQLERGSVQADVPVQQPPSQMQIRTPVVNLGVRGTAFRARVDDGLTLAEVVHGRVAVGAQAVDGGYGTRAEAGGIVLTPQPLLPAPALDGVPRRLERVLLQLPLAADGGVHHVRLQVHDRGTPSRLLAEAVFTPPLASWRLPLPDGEYRLLARAADGRAIEGQDAQLDFELAARPEPPFLLRPRADESLDQEPIVLAWSRNPEAARYRLQVAAAGDDFAKPLLTRDDLDAAQAEVSLPPGRYRWRVAGVRADGHPGPWGDAQAMRRLQPPPQPPDQQPARLDDGGVTVSWSAAGVAGARYQLQVAADAAFSAPRIDRETADTQERLAGLEPGRYFVRVRTLASEASDGREGAFGTAQIVDVPEPPPSRWWWWLLPFTLLLVP
ncbi:MAG: FecR domain-containing protein [Proteobacteria bacterium]|nr:FecR domain-containing protein [Pseudomonadota bacterium]